MDITSHSAGTPIAGFIYPVLKPVEIQQCMSELGMSLSSEELQDPAHNKEKLRKVFSFLLEVCAGKTEEDFQPTEAMRQKAQELPYPELHTEFSEILFYTCLRDLMTCSGYADFSWRDLHVPIPKRLRYQLSAVINLAKYREEQLKVYAELNEPRSALILALDETNQENAQLNEQLEQAESASKVQFQEMEEVVRECEELEVEIARNNKLQAAAREEAAGLKKQANDLKDEVATAVWALQESEAEEEKLRLKLVTSPDRRKSDLLVRKERLRKVKEECAQLEISVQECKTKVVNAMQALSQLDSVNGMLGDLKEEASKHAELVQKIETTRKNFAASDKQTSVVLKQIQESERQLARLEEKMVHQRKQHELQIDAAQDALEAAKSQLLRVEKDRRQGMQRVEAGEQQVRSMEDALENERQQSEAEIQGYVEEYKMLESSFLQQNQQRMDRLQSAN